MGVNVVVINCWELELLFLVSVMLGVSLGVSCWVRSVCTVVPGCRRVLLLLLGLEQEGSPTVRGCTGGSVCPESCPVLWVPWLRVGCVLPLWLEWLPWPGRPGKQRCSVSGLPWCA